jgi:hypothetical protein
MFHPNPSKKFKNSVIIILFVFIFLNSCSSSNENRNYHHEILLSEPIKIPQFHFDYLSENKLALQDYLASSSYWHVLSIDGAIIALNREAKDYCSPLLIRRPGGYSSSKYPYPERTFLNLSASLNNNSPSATKAQSKLLKSKFNDNTIVNLKMEKSENRVFSLMTLESQDQSLMFQVSESSNTSNREYTNEILNNVSSQMKLFSNAIRANNRFLNLSILPPGSVKQMSDDEVVIKQSVKTSDAYLASDYEYTVSGYINPTERGFIYLKVVSQLTKSSMNAVDKSYTIDDSDKEGTNTEYIGWSKNSNQKFNFCLQVSLIGGENEKDPKTPAEFQIWFQPSSNRSPRLLYKKSLLVNYLLK